MTRKIFLRFTLALLAGGLSSGQAQEAAKKEIVNGSDSFEFVYRVKLPEITGSAKLWVPVARTDALQAVKVQSITSELKHETVKDAEYGNEILVFSPAAADAGKSIEVKYSVMRKEKSAAKAGKEEPARFLKPEKMVPQDKVFGTLAAEAVAGKSGAMEKARALYDHTLARMKYDKTGTGWGRGDALWACDSKVGNCTDFHSYFIALARSQGIPARFAIGFTIPAAADEGPIAGYHCWAEFLADGKWVPVDISEASKVPALAPYYFGHHPANRFEVTRGRDLNVTPAPAGGPINFLIYPLLEVDGKVVKTVNEFSYKRTK